MEPSTPIPVSRLKLSASNAQLESIVKLEQLLKQEIAQPGTIAHLVKKLLHLIREQLLRLGRLLEGHAQKDIIVQLAPKPPSPVPKENTKTKQDRPLAKHAQQEITVTNKE
jgi:hypothetical protein